MKVEDPEQALTEAVCTRVREHLDGTDADLAETFTRQFYRWVSPDDIVPCSINSTRPGHGCVRMVALPRTVRGAAKTTRPGAGAKICSPSPPQKSSPVWNPGTSISEFMTL